MNKKKAIEILIQQKNKLEKSSFYQDETWVFHTASYIKDFFGESSTEFTFISQFRFTVISTNKTPEPDILYALDQKKQKALKFLDNCVDTIKNKGLYKPESKMLTWVKEPANLWKMFAFIVTTLLSVATLIFAIKKP